MKIVLFHESVEAFEVFVNGCGIPEQGCCKIGKKRGSRGSLPDRNFVLGGKESEETEEAAKEERKGG
jgi:hypothetical protein